MIKRKNVEPAGVREFRERRGWTQEQMADEVGATPLEVAAWEAGTVRVPAEQAQRMRAMAAMDPTDRLGRDFGSFLPGLLLFFALAAACVAVSLIMLSPPSGPAIDLPRVPDLSTEALAAWAGLAITRRLTAKLRRWPYAAGLLQGAAGVLTGMLVWTLRNPDGQLSDPLLLAICAVLALFAGLLAGWTLDPGEDDAELVSASPGAEGPLLADGGAAFGLDAASPPRDAAPASARPC